MDTIPQTPMQKQHKHWVKKIIFVIVIVIVIVIWCFGQQIWFASKVHGYQAVFLTSGQVYFGHLSAAGHFLKLTDIYYLQVAQSSQTDQQQLQQANQQPQLVKLGSELHGPEDVMYIERDKVLFWENMKDDSKVVTAIKQYKSK